MCSPQSKEQKCVVKMSGESAVEGIFEPVQISFARRCAFNGNHIETAGGISPAMLLEQEKLRGEYQLLTLAPVDTGERATPLCVFSVADFDEYYCIAVKHDQIKLAAATQPVLRQKAQTLLSKVLKCLEFGILAALCAGPLGHQRGVSGRRWTSPPTNFAQGIWRSTRWLALMPRLPERPSMRVSGNALSWPTRGARR